MKNKLDYRSDIDKALDNLVNDVTAIFVISFIAVTILTVLISYYG